jgi:hypothetical protein
MLKLDSTMIDFKDEQIVNGKAVTLAKPPDKLILFDHLLKLVYCDSTILRATN